MGHNAQHASAVFSTRETAEAWIDEHSLAGMLTKYPIDIPVYDHVISMKLLTTKKDHEKTGDFIGRFSSAAQEHYHYNMDDIE